MMYTDEQYAFLETFENGRLVQDLTEDELFIYDFFIRNHMLQPRADIEDGLHFLSELGKCVLAEHRAALEQREKEANDLIKQAAKEKKDKVSQYLHDFLLVLTGAVLACIADNIRTIVNWIVAFFF